MTKSWYDRLKDGLQKTRSGFVGTLGEIFAGKIKADEGVCEEMEELLIRGDMGLETISFLIGRGREKGLFNNKDEIISFLRDTVAEIFEGVKQVPEGPPPHIYMMVGINGTGKTTTCGKIAYRLKETGSRVLLVAADTFRPAAIEQLEIWAKKTGVGFFGSVPGADPSSVIFDAVGSASRKAYDHIIIDTAGGLPTRVNLMEELKKMKRVITQVNGGLPPEKLMLALDAVTGQNGLVQAKNFIDNVGVNGIALLKLDSSSKGGIAVSIAHEYKIPVEYIGVGEGLLDLNRFSPSEFAGALFEN